MPVTPATLLGLAIGDALGMPFETLEPFSPILMDWDGSFLSGASNTLQPERKPGEGTDDTKMAVALAKALLDKAGYEPSAALREYLAWFKSGDHRGIGNATREALTRATQGHTWVSSGVLHAEGNGTAMRVAPLGLYFRKSLTTVSAMARVDATLTHRSFEAQEGSVAVAIGVATLAEGLAEKHNILEPVLNFIRADPADPCITMVETRLLDVREFLKTGPDLKKVMEYLIEKGTKAHVADTVPAAFLCFVATDNFKDAVELAVRVGGDCDTTAAITGALAGTYYGEDQVEPYLSQLEGSADLRALNYQLWVRAPDIPVDE